MAELSYKQQLIKIKEILKEHEEFAEELIDLGNSKDHAKGEGYLDLINQIKPVIST